MACRRALGVCWEVRSGKWCRKMEKQTALSEWKDCTVSYAASDSSLSSALRTFMNPPTCDANRLLCYSSVTHGLNAAAPVDASVLYVLSN